MVAKRTFSLFGLTNPPLNMMMLPLSAKTVLLSRISTWLMAVFIAGSGVGVSRKEEEQYWGMGSSMKATSTAVRSKEKVVLSPQSSFTQANSIRTFNKAKAKNCIC